MSKAKVGSKATSVHSRLIELFNEQQKRHNFPIPHKPIKLEDLKVRKHPIQATPDEPPPAPPPPLVPLTKKNMELFQEQENQQNRHNQAATVITQVDGGQRMHHRHHDPEVLKLRNTIAQYECDTKKLMKTLHDERTSFRVATKELEKANELLKGEVVRIEKSFRDLLAKQEEELRKLSRTRMENDDLVTRNLRLQHDLSEAMCNAERMEKIIDDMQCNLDRERDEKKCLTEKCEELEQQLERMRATMCAWTACQAKSPERSMRQSVTCAVSKVVFFGSLIAVAVAGLLQVVQASSDDFLCDYVRESEDGFY